MSKSAKFAIRIQNTVLHELLQKVAERAYEQGHRDASEGKPMELDKVTIDQSLLRKFA